jgi:hypothetical protein
MKKAAIAGYDRKSINNYQDGNYRQGLTEKNGYIKISIFWLLHESNYFGVITIHRYFQSE